MVSYRIFFSRTCSLFILLICLLALAGEVFAGPSVRHGLRQYRQHDMHHGMGHMGKGTCPQLRYTVAAPDGFLKLKNPLEPDSRNLIAGEALFHTDAQPTACKVCHGPSGNGMGMMSPGLNPPPRNFSCFDTMKNISDGQMFWVIRNGSPGTGMVAYKSLSDKQIWQIILYLRALTH